MVHIKLSEIPRNEAVAEASRIILAGGIVAFPTETFYGLGVKYDDITALKRLYELKKRPGEKAMPLIIGNKGLLDLITTSLNRTAEILILRFWSGPLTILVPAIKGLPELITAGAGKVAVRMPGESFALDLVRSLPFPITATSANTSNGKPADNPDDVIGYFGDRLDMLIDGGKAPGGKPSTIIDITDTSVKVVRKGVISEEEILEAAAEAL